MQPPPKLFLRFFRWYCHPKLLKHIEGDLMELYRERLSVNGKRKADLDFIIDVVLLFRPSIIRPREGYSNVNIYAMYKSYLKTGWRNLIRNKGYSLINIGGLATGMAVTLLIGLWVYDELSFNKYFDNYERIAQVKQHQVNNGEIQTWSSMPYPLAAELRENYAADFRHIVMGTPRVDNVLQYENIKLKKSGMFFEPGAPEMFSLKMVYGDHGGLREPASIMLSASAAQVFFGNADPVGKMIRLENQADVKVTGVYEDIPETTDFAGLQFMSTWELIFNAYGLKDLPDPWRPNSFLLFVQLNENVSFEKASSRIKDAKLKKVNEQLAKKKPELFLHPMVKWHLYSEFENGVNVGGGIQHIWLFGTVGAAVLILACINFINLSTARSEKRAKEVGIRKTIGSRQSHLIGQFFSESLLTVSLSFLISMLIVQLALPYFNIVAAKHIGVPWNSLPFWVCQVSIIGVTSFISGCYPALYLSSFKPTNVLKGVFKSGRSVALPRQILVVMQFTVSVVLIIGTIVVYQQIQFAKNRPIGYSRQGLLSVVSSQAVNKHFLSLKDELLKTGVVKSVSGSQGSLTQVWGSSSGYEWPGKDPNQSIDFGTVGIAFDYGKTVEWDVKEGRDFSVEFPSDTSAVILNEAATRIIGFDHAVGEKMSWRGKPLQVIGVVRDMAINSPFENSGPIVYSLSKDPGLVLLRINPGLNPSESVEKVAALFKKYNPDGAFEYSFVDDDFNKKFAREELVGKLVGFFTILAGAISCLGIFGLASFVAEQRNKEVGIRKVMGASVLTLWTMLTKDFIVLVSIASFISIPLALYLVTNWLQGYEFRVHVSWWIFGVALAGALTVTLLTVSYHAVRAATTNPIKCLRTE